MTATINRTKQHSRLSGLINTNVYDSHGLYLGNVVELILNVRNGRISHVVLEVDTDEAVLPWEALNFNKAKGVFELSRTPPKEHKRKSTYVFAADNPAIH